MVEISLPTFGRGGLWVAPFILLLAACTAGNGAGLDAGGRPIGGPPGANSDFQEIQDTIWAPMPRRDCVSTRRTATRCS
jgi:hypothetical protein